MTFDAGSEFLVDTPSIYLNATEKLEIEAPLIYLGKSQQSEDDGGVGATQATKGHPLVLGDEDDLWKSTLCDIIDAMLTTSTSQKYTLHQQVHQVHLYKHHNMQLSNQI